MPAEFFFTLAMHLRLSTNFLLRRFDLVLGPALQRRPPQQPHFLNNPLFHRVGLLEISLVVRYGKGYRYDSLAKTRVRLKKCQKRLVAEFRRRHFAKSPSIRESPAYAASLCIAPLRPVAIARRWAHNIWC